MLDLRTQLMSLGFRSSFDPVDGYKYYLLQYLYHSPHPRHGHGLGIHLNTGACEEDELACTALANADAAAKYLLEWLKFQCRPSYAWPDGSLYWHVRLPIPCRDKESLECQLNEELTTLVDLPSTPSQVTKAILDLHMKVRVIEAEPLEEHAGRSLQAIFDEDG